MTRVIPDAKKYILSNGLRVVLEKIEEVRSVAIGIFLGSGSGTESDRESGICHFIEHMVFKGTPKRTTLQIASEIDSIGGRINASTGKEYTNYYAIVIDEHFDIALDVLSDIFLNSLFARRDIELEKGVVLSEINMYKDTPDEYIHDLFAETILSGHKLGRNTLGKVETVKIFNRNTILNFISKAYHPDNIIISVAGDLEEGKILKDIEKKFKFLSGKTKMKREKLPQITPLIRFESKETEQVHFCLGTKGVSQSDEDRYAFAVMDNVLGGSVSSRLFQEIREKRGLSYSIFSYNSSFKDFGIFAVYAGVKREDFEKTIELILKELNKIKEKGITKKELQRAKEYIRGNLVLGLESTYSRMNYLARSELYYNRTITVNEIFEKVNKVTEEDILRVANENFKNRFLTLVAIGPFKEREQPIKSLKW